MSLAFNAPEQKIFGGARDRSYPAPAQLLHVSIFHTGPGIDDLVRFYQVVLNMRYVFKTTYPAFEFIAISPDDENHRVGFVNVLTDGPAGKASEADIRDAPLRPCRIEHTSWLYRDYEEILLTAKRIHEELGLWPRSTRHGGVDLTIDYDDPDGNRVELLSQWKSKSEILFGLYQRSGMSEAQVRTITNPYMPMSMEKLLGLYESGVPVETLQDREYCKSMIEAGKL
jgi:catechol 2,3-dioxygenase-like lactoylglutathione lyase family enzyme